MTIEQMLFYVFAGLAILGAGAVVVSGSVVRMALWLIVSLGGVGGLFLLLHADFLGASQLMIYVGGTVVMLVFGVMLTAGRSIGDVNASSAEMVGTVSLGGLFLVLLMLTVGSVDWELVASRQPISPAAADLATSRRLTSEFTPGAAGATESDATARVQAVRLWTAQRELGRNTLPLGMSLLGFRHGSSLTPGETVTLGTGYLLPFEIISMHLLVVLIGAAYLARAKRRVNRPEQAIDGKGPVNG